MASLVVSTAPKYKNIMVVMRREREEKDSVSFLDTYERSSHHNISQTKFT